MHRICAIVHVIRYSALWLGHCILALYIPLMFDTVPVAMETYYSQCPRQEKQALARI